MNKLALFIPRPGMSSMKMCHGYVNALRATGWQVFVNDLCTKISCRDFVTRFKPSVIFTFSRYGMRQLDIEAINENNVTVVVDALPLNRNGETIDNLYEIAHDDESEIVSKIDSCVVKTHFEPHIIKDFFSGWQDNGVDIVHVPLAADIIGTSSFECKTLIDVGMVANFAHRPDVFWYLIKPLFDRLALVGRSYQAHGDELWAQGGLDYMGPISDFASIHSIYCMSKVCPNVHTNRQKSLQACVNDRTFDIVSCGGIQVVDNAIAQRYLDDFCIVADNKTDFIHAVEELSGCTDRNFEKARAGVKHIVDNHTYFHRLQLIFELADLYDLADSFDQKGQRLGIQYYWDMLSRLNLAGQEINCHEEITKA